MIWIYATLASWIFLVVAGVVWALTGIVGLRNREQERLE